MNARGAESGRGRAARTLALLVLGATACASAGSRGVSPVVGGRFYVAGYHAYWTRDAWEAYPWDALDQLYFFELEIGADGGLAERHGWPDQWSGLLRRAGAAGVSVIPTVTMQEPGAFESVFASSERTARLVDELVGLVAADPRLGGIHLDLEVFQPVELTARDGYTAFVARLGRALRVLDPALSLSVFALAFDDDDAYNERALAELADFVVVQGYDFHHLADARAGPLAAVEGWGRLNWTNVLDRFRAFGVPPRKIVMAVPLYGYEWPVDGPDPGAATRGEAVIVPLAPPADVVPELPRARARAADYGLRRDAESGIPFYAYRDGSGWRQGWFEDAESLRAKYAFVREHGLGGVALFPLAYGDSAVWEDLRAAFSPPRAGTPPGTTR